MTSRPLKYRFIFITPGTQKVKPISRQGFIARADFPDSRKAIRPVGCPEVLPGSYFKTCFPCDPERGDGYQCIKNTRFFASLRMTVLGN
ncbi:MAG: hypothetical protein PHX53_02960, partial [Syntrophales bacterium]|nr:hypothetical protein [Syntrophales bacterium]